jgi:hypothetical protein
MYQRGVGKAYTWSGATNSVPEGCWEGILLDTIVPGVYELDHGEHGQPLVVHQGLRAGMHLEDLRTRGYQRCTRVMCMADMQPDHS